VNGEFRDPHDLDGSVEDIDNPENQEEEKEIKKEPEF
jgi:preprotein translocase subunit SecF